MEAPLYGFSVGLRTRIASNFTTFNLSAEGYQKFVELIIHHCPFLLTEYQSVNLLKYFQK
jgi:hypothetical protein